MKEQHGDPVFVQTRGGPRKEDWDGAPALARLRIKPLKSHLHGVIGELADLSSHEQNPEPKLPSRNDSPATLSGVPSWSTLYQISLRF